MLIDVFTHLNDVIRFRIDIKHHITHLRTKHLCALLAALSLQPSMFTIVSYNRIQVTIFAAFKTFFGCSFSCGILTQEKEQPKKVALFLAAS